MVATALLIVFILLVLGLLLVPLELYINTIKNQYYMQLKGLARATVEGHEDELIQIRLRVFFRNFYFYPLKKREMIKKKKKEKRAFRKGVKKTSFRKILKVLRSFKIKRLFVDIDTGDCLTNAKLYPVFSFLNYHKRGFSINFEGRNQMVLHLHNRPIYLIASFINI